MDGLDFPDLRKTILIADDREITRKVIKSCFKETCTDFQNFNFEEFISGNEIKHRLEIYKRNFNEYSKIINKEIKKIKYDLEKNRLLSEKEISGLIDDKNSLERKLNSFHMLAILDHEMPPGPNGLELVRDYSKYIPIILYNGADETVKKKALKYGARAYFSRPVNPLDLCREVREIFGVRKKQEVY